MISNLISKAFIEQVRAIRQIEVDDQKVIEKVKGIADTFSLNTTSPVINIDQSLASSIKDKLDKGDEKELANIHFYDEIYDAICFIIKTDSLIKWKHSSYFPTHLVDCGA